MRHNGRLAMELEEGEGKWILRPVSHVAKKRFPEGELCLSSLTEIYQIVSALEPYV